MEIETERKRLSPVLSRRAPHDRTEQSSDLSSGSSVQSSSDDQDDHAMYDNTVEHHDSPSAGIDALRIKNDESPSKSPSSSSIVSSAASGSGSGHKRRASGSLPASTANKRISPSYVQRHEYSPQECSRDISYSTPKKHLLDRAVKKQPNLKNSDHFVLPTGEKSQRIDSGLTPFSRQPSWPTKVPPVAGLMKENVPGFNTTPVMLNHPRRSNALFRQPETSVITQEQLAAEVKGIYAGLVMVEAKSINIDAQQAADPNSKLAPEQWQALIALRRTLLYEHHDFLMATQHPSASPALRGLAAKYCMPARMWKHGIHGFLEVLRHRRPDSQEYMLTFIYLAYDMMALLYETVPAFTDTWIECLGDLARYRMAIEEDKEVHAIWGGVAARWYTLAADRHPQIGRLYHHLGILERPSLRKFYFYSRSLTSVVPFINARESLGTLCAPILQDDAAIRHSAHSAEAMTICYHARSFSGQSQEVIERDGNDALALLKQQPAGKIASYATPLAVTNIAGMFEYGMPNNVFKQIYASALARAAHNARPAILNPPVMSEAAKAISDSEAFAMTTYPTKYTIDFFAICFNSLIRQKLDHATVRDLLQYVHVNLVWLSSLLDLRNGLSITAHRELVDNILASIDYEGLALFLNTLAGIDPITTRVIEHAQYNTFLLPEHWRERKPLAEDFMIRGLAFAEGYLPLELFENMEDDDGSRNLETPARLHLRAERVEWLACCVAQPSRQSQLTFDRVSKRYGARTLADIEAHPWIKSEHSTSPASSPGEYDALSMRSEDQTQFTPSVDSYVSRTDDSYVDVNSFQSGSGSAKKIAMMKTEV